MSNHVSALQPPQFLEKTGGVRATDMSNRYPITSCQELMPITCEQGVIYLRKSCTKLVPSNRSTSNHVRALRHLIDHVTLFESHTRRWTFRRLNEKRKAG